MKRIVIAIDGHSSCGKSTMAKTLAQEIGYVYIDTGAMYRAVTLYAMRKGYIADKQEIKVDELRNDIENISISFHLDDTTKRPQTYLNGECVEKEIRTLEVSRYVSSIAALPFVRTAMVNLQRKMGDAKGIVMDGRDIGTVVFPNAELKIFVTANAETRAKRRYDELTAKGELCNYEEILDNVKQRDYLDSTRKVSPLKKADDAVVLDNTDMTIPEQEAWLLKQYKRVAEA